MLQTKKSKKEEFLSTHIGLLKTKDNWAIYTSTLTADYVAGMTAIEDFTLPFVIFGLKKVNGHGHIGTDGKPFIVYMPLKQFGLEIVNFVGFPEVNMTQPVGENPTQQEFDFVDVDAKNGFKEVVTGTSADGDNDLD